MTTTPRHNWLLLSFFLILIFSNNVSAQFKLNASAGVGFFELINVGLGIEVRHTQINFSVGRWPNNRSKNHKTFVIDYIYHFGGKPNLTDRRPWFFKLGFIFFKNESLFYKNNYKFFHSRIGRNFNLNNHVGVAFDLGFNWFLRHHRYEIATEITRRQGIDFLVFPAGGLRVFYRIGRRF